MIAATASEADDQKACQLAIQQQDDAIADLFELIYSWRLWFS